MLKGLGDVGNLMKLQKEMKNMQKKLKKFRMDGASSDGTVKVTVNGEFSLLSVSIDEAGDAKKLEKMVLEAVNDAVEKMKQYSASEMAKLTGGMNIPGLG